MPRSCGGAVSELGSFGSSLFFGLSGPGAVVVCCTVGGCAAGLVPVTALTIGCSRRVSADDCGCGLAGSGFAEACVSAAVLTAASCGELPRARSSR